jgi:hypothetical protein
MKTKQTAPISLALLNVQPLDLSAFLQALQRVDLLFPILQKGMSRGYFADVNSAKPMLLKHEVTDTVMIKLAIQFESRMAGCACNEDPTPEQPLPEYMECELVFDQNGWIKSFNLTD